MASEYNWHPGIPGKSVFKVETRNLGWWVLLAILISVILHIVLDLVLGVAIAYVVVRTNLVGRQFLDALAMLPLAVPGLVLAFGYLAMTQEGKLFDFLNPVRDPLILLVIAYAVRRLPYVVRSAAAATAAGLDPVKVNVVVMRGINDDEVVDFAALTIDHPWHVRFIELMPVGELRDLTWDHVVPTAEVLERIESLGALTPDAGPARGNGPARYLRLPNAKGTIGVITPMTHTYCESCNRVRLTADGRLRTCLFGDHEVLLRDAVRAGLPLEPLFRKALSEKPKEHQLLQMQIGGLRALSQVGG
jgi:hypothetical protein